MRLTSQNFLLTSGRISISSLGSAFFLVVLDFGLVSWEAYAALEWFVILISLAEVIIYGEACVCLGAGLVDLAGDWMD